jgi:membrane-associated phospholipid phosphatase
MAGIAGFTGLYLALFEKYNTGNLSTMLVLLGLCGAMAWARTALKRHTLRELLSGAVLGFFSIYVLLSR